jgi:hypothetical protein
MHKLIEWFKRHKLDVLIATLLMAIGGTVSAVNMTGYPQRFEDEGTYVSQAYAIKEQGTLTHYTYWYDHPPLGWIQMAGHLALTNALHRYGSAITAGREYMLVLHIATIGLLFALARRLKIGSLAAGLGTLAFAFSPLVVEFSRYVLLDNIALPWAMAAFVLALSPRRSLGAAVGSALCMAIAILSKETFVSLLPVLLFTLYRSGDKRNRRYILTAFGTVFITVCGFYVLYAALKNELFPGPGHVSLLGTLKWQLVSRQGSGSIFDAASGTRGLVGYWLNIDFWLLAAGAATLPFALWFKNLRPAGLALFIGLALLLRSGYLPYPYIIALLPFAALTFAGALDHLIVQPIIHGKTVARTLSITAAVALIASTAVFVAPTWHSKLTALTTVDQDASSRQAVSWIDTNIGRDNRLVVESALWTDLQGQGFDRPNPVWLYKTETDPQVTKEIGGWQGIDYVVLNGPTVGATNFDQSFPTVSAAIKHGRLIAQFGQDNQKILVYKVNH